jgi:hypothetical protein
MKKLVMPFIMATALFACSTSGDTASGTASSTATAASATSGSVTTSGPDVELMKRAGQTWSTGDWAGYLACYADTAKSIHNAWAVNSKEAKTMPALVEEFKKSRELMDGNVSIDNGIYEVITTADGTKYGHAWVELSWKTKKGGVGKTVLFNSYGIKDGKLLYEWPIYDTKDFAKLGQ